jgi:tRNA-specific 2-thiouridylase
VPGPILDLEDRVVGTHRGLAHYTVGQRRGLGLATGEPRYVVAIDAERNAVVVGGAADTLAAGCVLREVNWLAPPPPEDRPVTARVRAGPAEHPARVAPLGGSGRTVGGVRVRFAEPVRAVTPGQACVLYDGDLVLGGGEIDAVERLPAGPGRPGQGTAPPPGAQRTTSSATQEASTRR